MAAFNETTYSQGILPIDTYKDDLDGIATSPYNSTEKPCEPTLSAGRNSTLRPHAVRNLKPNRQRHQRHRTASGLVSVKASKTAS